MRRSGSSPSAMHMARAFRSSSGVKSIGGIPLGTLGSAIGPCPAQAGDDDRSRIRCIDRGTLRPAATKAWRSATAGLARRPHGIVDLGDGDAYLAAIVEDLGADDAP